MLGQEPPPAVLSFAKCDSAYISFAVDLDNGGATSMTGNSSRSRNLASPVIRRYYASAFDGPAVQQRLTGGELAILAGKPFRAAAQCISIRGR
jgi:hypothetical protein